MIATVTAIVLTIFGLFFFYTAVSSFRNPVGFANSLSLQPVGRSGEVEIRAQYGGFFFVAALSQFIPFLGWLSPETALVISLVIFGGLITGRLGALVMAASEEPLTTAIKGLFLVDGAGAMISLMLLYANIGN